MILSHEHKFIFIHIGKTGGTSIEKVLCKHLGIDFETTKKDPNGEWWKHEWAKGILKRVGEDAWNEYFTFAFVRNPYDMLLSLYSMYTQYPEYTDRENHWDLYHPWNQFKSFEDLITAMREDSYESDNNWRVQLDGLGAKNTPQVWNGLKNLQSKYLEDEDQNLLVDFVGKYETLQDDFNYCCKKIGIPELDLVWHGATKHKNYRDIYTNDMIDFVTEHSWRDIHRFGYHHSIAKSLDH